MSVQLAPPSLKPLPRPLGGGRLATTASAADERARQPLFVISNINRDAGAQETFYLGPLLGKGSYAQCFEVSQTSTKMKYACKLYQQEKLKSTKAKRRVWSEITIHQRLHHKNIVRLYFYGMHERSVALLMEKCNNRNLRHLLQRRKFFLEPEARIYLRQLLVALRHLHQLHICHRDIKLDNVFLHDSTVKLGDFGFAIRLRPGEATRNFCGTPNYIAPEVLRFCGYGLPVDVWAVGVLAFTMLYGSTPFQSESTKETYAQIAANNYRFPEEGGGHVSSTARDFIASCLKADPADRPTCEELLMHGFLRLCDPVATGPVLRTLPSHGVVRLHSGLRVDVGGATPALQPPSGAKARKLAVGLPPPDSRFTDDTARPHTITLVHSEYLCRLSHISMTVAAAVSYLHQRRSNLNAQIVITANKPSQLARRDHSGGDAERKHGEVDHHWVVKWVDYSRDLGLCYQLCTGVVGILFNDRCSMVTTGQASIETTYFRVIADDAMLEGEDAADRPQITSTTWEVEHLSPKEPFSRSESLMRFKLLHCFGAYMADFPCSQGLAVDCTEAGPKPRRHMLISWKKNARAACFLLSNYTMQVNFVDHVKLVVSCTAKDRDAAEPSGNPIDSLYLTYVDAQNRTLSGYFSETFRNQAGLIEDLIARMECAQELMPWKIGANSDTR